jgi:hypothetical protein
MAVHQKNDLARKSAGPGKTLVASMKRPQRGGELGPSFIGCLRRWRPAVMGK